MKRIFVMILTIVMGCSVCFMFASCKSKKQTDDNTFYYHTTPIVGSIALDLSSKKECDVDTIQFDCQYGYYSTKESVRTSPTGWEDYTFDKAVLFYDLLTWDEVREMMYDTYFRHKSIGIVPVDSFQEYMEKEISEKYKIIKEIPQESFLTDEYYVETGGFLKKTIRKYNHQETVKVLQEELLPESGFISFGVSLVYYSTEKDDYIVVYGRSTNHFKYTIYDGKKIKFEHYTEEFRNNKIIYSDEEGNVIWEDTESSFSAEE